MITAQSTGNAMARVAWMTGDFAAFSPYTRAGDDEIFRRVQIRPGERLLDAACGAGAFALRAAKAGADVTGIDIAANLVAAARAMAETEGLSVAFDEGDIESLPYDNETFDTVVSQFGAIFVTQPEVVVAEMARVLKPGGRLELFCWTPRSWVGRLMQTVGRNLPTPPNIPSPLAWGDEAIARARLAPHFSEIRVAHGTYAMSFPFDSITALDFFLRNMGPVAMAYAAIPDGPQKRNLHHELVSLFEESNEGGKGKWMTKSDFLQLEGRKQ